MSVPTERPLFTLTEAAHRTGVSRSTIRRRREGGAFPNARQDGDGQWLIPVEDLLGAGLTLARPSTGEQGGPALAVPVSVPGEQRVAELERALAVERVRREAAEQLAAERGRHLDDLRRLLRPLEQAPSAPVEPPSRAVESLPGAPGTPERGRWWRGRERR